MATSTRLPMKVIEALEALVDLRSIGGGKGRGNVGNKQGRGNCGSEGTGSGSSTGIMVGKFKYRFLKDIV